MTTFIIEELVTYEIEAADEEDAVRLWTEQGEKAPGYAFGGVHERQCYPKEPR